MDWQGQTDNTWYDAINLPGELHSDEKNKEIGLRDVLKIEETRLQISRSSSVWPFYWAYHKF